MRAALALALLAGAAAAQEWPAEVEKRFGRETAALREELSRAARQGLDDLAALRALPAERRAAVEALLDLVDRTPDPYLMRCAVDLSAAELVPLPVMAQRLAPMRLVGVGERHDRAADHQVQLAVLELLAGHPGGTALGLEMVARPHQAALDDYGARRTDEAAFLEAVDWRRTWGFDWGLYAPLFRLARHRGLPLVALNLPREVVREVSRQGLAALAPELRAQLPAEIDLSQAPHRSRVMESLASHAHGPSSPERLDRMYQAMCVWDEAMAESAQAFLARSPQIARIVVLAGSGHLEHGDGIPSRAARRGAGSWAVVLPRPLDGAHLGRLRGELLRPPARFVVFTAP